MHSKTKIRFWLVVFMIGLVLSGVSAIPLESELVWLGRFVENSQAGETSDSGIGQWVLRVRDALIETNNQYPFLGYGTDWLAFAHFVIAIAFIGPFREPVRNIWVIQFGMIACVLVIPYALLMGAVREIPLGWRLIDCLFGVFGFIPLWLCYRQVRRLEKQCSEN